MNASKLHIDYDKTIINSYFNQHSNHRLFNRIKHLLIVYIKKRSMYFLVAELLIQLQKNKQTGPCKMD